MERLTYRQAFDKITEAYIKGEIEIFESEFCFCGTLCNNRLSWQAPASFRQRFHNYTYVEYGKMEAALFSPWKEIEWLSNGDIDYPAFWSCKKQPDFEKKLFDGMCAALEVLKQIHIERGEIIDETIPAFTKRSTPCTQ